MPLGTRAARFAPHAAADRAFTARLAEALADHDEALLAAYVNDEASVAYEDLRRALAAQTRRARIHPVYFGSAITGAGVDALAAGIPASAPTTTRSTAGSTSGASFDREPDRNRACRSLDSANRRPVSSRCVTSSRTSRRAI